MSNLSPRQRLRSWSRGFASDTTMRAAVYDRAALEGIRVIATRAPPSPPSKGALLVRVKACGVNPVDAKGVIGDKLPTFLRPLALTLTPAKRSDQGTSTTSVIQMTRLS